MTAEVDGRKDLATGAERRERMLNAALSSISDYAYIFDREGRFLFANQPLLDLWGIPLEQAVGKTPLELSYPVALAERLRRQVQLVFETETSVSDETPYTSAAGRDGLYEYTFSPVFGADGEVDFVVGATRDVTERKRTEAALRASLEEFRTLAEAMPQMVWIARPDGWNIYINPQWMSYTGLTLEESLGHGWSKPFHPDDQQRASAAWRLATETVGTYSLECRLRRADGVYRWWLIRSVPVKDGAGDVLKWFGTATDIHDLKVAQLELSQSRERFAHVFNSSLVAIGIKETESGVLVDINASFAEFFGYTRDEMIGRTTLDLGLWADPMDRTHHVGPDGSGAQVEVALRSKSGELRHALVSMETMGEGGAPRPLSIMFLLDITQRRLLESQLLQAQKMEAVGRLAGGVAHDFNNSLGVILGYTELLLRHVDEGQKGKLEQIRKATERAAVLTRQLLAFSRKQVVDPTVLDLNLLLTDLETMLGRLIGEDIDLALVPGEALGQVKADAGQLEQVVMNLCVNARDAMPDGGLLRIETSNVDVDAAHADLLDSVAPGRYVMLAVSDGGCGIAREVLPKIFEPFYTTKAEGKGTGLGLAMVYGIVKQAGGHVAVYSEVGQGTTFRVYLPRIDEPMAAGVADEAPMPDRGWETILLVEDEEALRAITQEILSEHGYRVLEASGADLALAIARDHPEPIHLLLTDVVMPGTNGRDLANALVAAHPETRVLFMSGYTDDVIAHRGVLESGTLLLEKPFTVLALLRHVRAALVAGTPKGTA